MRRLNYLLLGLLLTTQINVAQDELLTSVFNINQFEEMTSADDWKTYKNKKGVSLKYRWLHLNEDSKTRQISISFQSSKKVKELMHLIKHPDLAPQWNGSIKKQQVFEDADSSWVSHTVFAIPYPLNQQDLVVKNKLIIEQDEVIVLANSVPDHIAELEDTKRQQFYLSRWKFKNSENKVTEVEFSLVSMSKSVIPRFIRDPIVFNRLVNSFIELKNWEAETY